MKNQTNQSKLSVKKIIFPIIAILIVIIIGLVAYFCLNSNKSTTTDPNTPEYIEKNAKMNMNEITEKYITKMQDSVKENNIQQALSFAIQGVNEIGSIEKNQTNHLNDIAKYSGTSSETECQKASNNIQKAYEDCAKQIVKTYENLENIKNFENKPDENQKDQLYQAVDRYKK